MSSLAGKTVIVTGGGTGIGAASSLYLSSKGANVVITGRRSAALAQVVEQSAGKIFSVTADVTSEADWKNLIETVEKKFSAIDALILNAGWEGPLVQDPVVADLGQLRQLFDTNVFGAVIGAKYTIPSLIKSKGAFIVVSSIAGAMPRTGGAVPLYCVSKSAADALVRQFSAIYNPKGVRVYGVNPALYESEMAQKVAEVPEFKALASTLSDLAFTCNPLGNIGNGLDFGALFYSLLAGETKYVSGDNIVTIPSLTPGKPITYNIGYAYTHLTTSTDPAALIKANLALPLHDVNGDPFPEEEEHKLREALKTHAGIVAEKAAAWFAAANAAGSAQN